MLALAEGGLAFGRAAEGWADAQWYTDAGIPFSPHVYAALNLLWVLMLLLAAYGVFKRRRWARYVCLGAMPGYALFALAWMAVFARSDYAIQRLPFTGAATFLYCAIVIWLLRGVRAGGAKNENSMDDRAAYRPPELPDTQ